MALGLPDYKRLNVPDCLKSKYYRAIEAFKTLLYSPLLFVMFVFLMENFHEFIPGLALC